MNRETSVRKKEEEQEDSEYLVGFRSSVLVRFLLPVFLSRETAVYLKADVFTISLYLLHSSRGEKTTLKSNTQNPRLSVLHVSVL